MASEDTPIAVVRWKDSTGADVQITAAEAEHTGLIEIQSVGHLVFVDEEKICIAEDWLEEANQFRQLLWIPLVNVTEMGTLDSSKIKPIGNARASVRRRKADR